MSDEEEKPLDLRDKIALEVLNGLISHSKNDTGNLIADIFHYINYRSEDVRYMNKIRKDSSERLERAVRACYKVADIVRKVRLSSFE